MGAMGLSLLALGAGCDDDDHDDPDNVFVVSIVPADQQTNVNTNSQIIIRFSVAIDPKSYSGTQQIILVDQANSMVPMSITPTPSQPASEFITITPATPLAVNLTYGVAVRENIQATNSEYIQAPWAATFSTGPVLQTIPGFPPFLTPNPSPPNTGAPGTFTLTGQLNTARSRHTATRLQSGDVFVCGGASPVRVSAGGTTLRSAELYRPTSGTWQSSTANGGNGMFYARYGHTATLLGNGKVLITGGWDERAVWDTAELYDPSTDSFGLATGKMQRSRTAHEATLLSNGNVLLTGGFSDGGNGGILRSMEVFDQPTGTFLMSPQQMTAPRCYHASILLGDAQTVLMSGGIVPWGGFGPVAMNLCDTFKPDPAQGQGQIGTLLPVGAMQSPRAQHKLTLLTQGVAAGLVVAVAGATMNSAEVFDVTQQASNGNMGAWALVADNMNTNRRGHSATQIVSGPDSGKILVVGGAPTGVYVPVLYIAPHNWVSTEIHNCGSCVANNDGSIFDPFGFGQSVSAPFRGVDVTAQFVPTMDNSPTPQQTFMVGTSFNPFNQNGRYFHTATTLRSGHVLLAGGWDCPFCGPPGSGPEAALATSELYNP
jgi:hypothetical protein